LDKGRIFSIGGLIILLLVGAGYYEYKKQVVFTANGVAAAEFLADNALRPEVTVLPSGLQYEVVVEGHGERPGLEDTVSLRFTGFFIDGTVFDNSEQLAVLKGGGSGDPAPLPVKSLIAGGVEGLLLMPVGSSWNLYIPPDLAYGKKGNNIVPPNSALVFQIELVEILPPEAL
jgi:FKBP-type peptidyl-prolyl cis-trans isomerase FklB